MAVEINLDGIIYSWMVEDIQLEVDKAKRNNNEDIKVLISSPGGFVYPGLKLYHLFKNYVGNVHMHIVSMAASMASVVAMAGNKITAESASVFMIHNASSYVEGDHREMQKNADYLNSVTGMLAGVYSEKTGKSIKDVRQLMDDETYFFGSEMQDAGFTESTEEVENKDSVEDIKAFAKMQIDECTNELKESKKEAENMQGIAALLTKNNEAHKPAKSADKPKKMEVKKTMDLKTFLAENPTAMAEYNSDVSAARDAGFSEAKAEVGKIIPFMESDTYPKAIKDLGIKALKGEMTTGELTAGVAVFDALKETKNSEHAKKETEENGDTASQNHDNVKKPSNDGTINSEEDYQAMIKKAKGGSV